MNPTELLKPLKTLAKNISVEPLQQGRFINLKKIQYVNPLGKASVWEMATRPTKPVNSPVDAVIIVPILHYPQGETKVALVRQFRPPCDGVCVEFPAGLVDEGDDIQSAALRELQEECGLKGQVRKVTGACYGDPGLSNATCSFVWVDVDMQENSDPQPKWQDNEVIEVVHVSVKDLDGELESWREEGYKIDSRVEAILIGLSLAN